MWQEKYSPTWPIMDQNGGGQKKKKKRKGKRELQREKRYLLFKFHDDRTDGFKRSKRESPSS